MQDDKCAVSQDEKRAVIQGRTFVKAKGPPAGIFEHGDEAVFVQKYTGLDRDALEALLAEIRARFSQKDGAAAEEDAWARFVSRADRAKEFQSIAAPAWCWYQTEADGGESLFTASRLPEGFSQKYHPLSRAVSRPNFPLQGRVMAALHLAGALRSLYQRFGVYRLPPDAFFVNTETGDVQILLEKLLMRNASRENWEEDFLWFSGETELEEPQLVRFGAYAAFRLLCVENPYDGQDTLVKYPLLTPGALRKIHSGEDGFIFSECGNRFSEYTARGTLMRWNNIPSGLQKSMEGVLSARESLDTESWLKQMRMLRDSLVYVNGRFRLCDPEVSNNVLFVDTGEYKIPIWPRKAVYWYHVGLLEEQTDHGVAAGINADGYLENRSTEHWRVSYKKNNSFLAPGHSQKPEAGMQIQMGDACLRIVSGEVSGAPCAAAGDGSWPDNGQEA